MTGPQTSLEAYAHLIVNGILAERQLEAWIALEQWGPMTAREMDDQTGRRGLWKRLSELKGLGLVRERDVRLCRVSHRAALVWEHVPHDPALTYTRPAKLAKPTYWMAIAPCGQILYAGGDRAAAERIAGARQADIVKARQVKRWVPKK